MKKCSQLTNLSSCGCKERGRGEKGKDGDVKVRLHSKWRNYLNRSSLLSLWVILLWEDISFWCEDWLCVLSDEGRVFPLCIISQSRDLCQCRNFHFYHFFLFSNQSGRCIAWLKIKSCLLVIFNPRLQHFCFIQTLRKSMQSPTCSSTALLGLSFQNGGTTAILYKLSE